VEVGEIAGAAMDVTGDPDAPQCTLSLMRVLVGTSGYSYKEWKGPFYPEDLPAGKFLGYYAAHLPTVEINNTFYRMPTSKLIEGWASEVPETFTFAVKAPQRITHIAKLANAAETTDIFVRTVSKLGPRLGPLLFQLPPFLRKDRTRGPNCPQWTAKARCGLNPMLANRTMAVWRAVCARSAAGHRTGSSA